MRNKIVDYFVKKGWRDTDIYTYLKINGYVLLVSTILVLFVANVNHGEQKSIFIILGSFLFFLQMIFLFSYKNAGPKTIVYSIVHLFLNNKDEREMQMNRNYREKNTIVKKRINIQDKIKYIKENISDKKSMVKFILERDVRNNLLNWSTFLPLDLMDLDSQKQVLSHDRMFKPGKCGLDKDMINEKFKEYSSRDLVRLFTSYYYFDDYLYCLEAEYEGSFPVKKNIKELRNYIMDISEKDYALNKEYPWLEKLNSNYAVVKNKRELFDWAEAMQNCLKSYDDRLKRKASVVLSYHDYGEFLYVIEIFPHTGMVKEIKGYKNEPPYKSDDLRIRKEIFKACIK